MNRLPRVLGLAGLGLLLGSSPVRLHSAPAPDFGSRIAQFVAEGRTDRAHAALYWLYALRAPERLPPELRADLPAGAAARLAADEGTAGALRCGATLLRGVRSDLSGLPPEERATAETLLQGAPARVSRVAGKTVTHRLPNWILTEHFSVEWGPTLTDPDGTSPDDADHDGVPDVVEQWARYFEASYAAEVTERGYDASGIADVYVPVLLGNSAPGTTDDDIGGTTYALTFDEPLRVVVTNNFAQLPGNEDPEGKNVGIMKVTAAHEFHHVLQFTALPIQVGSPTWDSTQDDWWLEASATWMEDEVFDEVNDYYQYYAGAHGWATLAATGLAVPSTSGDYTTKAYGNAIFGKYLSEHLGGAQTLRQVWDLIDAGRRILFDNDAGTSVAGGALDVLAADKGLGGLGPLFLGFAAANAVMDYRDGAFYGAVPLQAPTLTASASSPNVPRYLGAHYLRGSEGAAGGAAVALTGAPAASWGLGFLLQRPDYDVVLGDVDAGGAPALSLAAWTAGQPLWAIPAFLSPRLPGDPLPTGYDTQLSAASPAVAVPGEVRTLAAAPAAGGLDLVWDPPAAGGTPAGYVVRWKRSAAALFSSRTLFGPAARIELRGLAAVPYDVEVFAYGAAGEPGPPAATTATPLAPAATPTPSAEPYADVHLSSADGGGGGGGGGCFLRALGRPRS